MATKGSHQIRHNRKSKKGKVFPAGKGGIPNKIQVKQYVEITEPFNKEVPTADHLPIETAILVPSTSHRTRISDDEFEKRILETKKFLADNFGGYSAIIETGGWFETTKDHKRTTKPVGWKLESTRHSLASKGIKTYHKRHGKIYGKFLRGFNKAGKISLRYQTQLERDAKHNYLARGLWGFGAGGGGILGLVGAVAATGTPVFGVGGLLTGGMAGTTLAGTAYRHLPLKITKHFEVNTRKEAYQKKHLPPNFLGVIPVTRKMEKRIDKGIEDFHIPYEKQIGDTSTKAFETMFGWYFNEAEKSGDMWKKNSKELDAEMSKSFNFLRKKKTEEKTKV
jgi:hypothetical protein